MKTLMKIGEWIAAGFIILGTFFTLLWGLIVVIPHMPRYMRMKGMSA